MPQHFLVDAGPLVAYLMRRDQHHLWAVSHFQTAPVPLFTCEAVLVEAEHLVERIESGTSEKLRLLLERGVIAVRFSLAEQLSAVLNLQRRYADLPMSLADACLVRMSEIDERALVFTTDSDFRIYRKRNRKVIPLISPGPVN